MKRNQGMTMIELLTVMAIIAVLSAIIFPVFSAARVNAAKSGDISSMNTLRSALQLYEADQGGYPPALLGFVTLYQSGPNAGNIIPADDLAGFLYPKRINAISVLRPDRNRAAVTSSVTAVWPNATATAVGSDPLVDTNGDGQVSSSDDVAGARQAFGPSDLVRGSDGEPVAFYEVSGYDTSRVNSPSGERVELRYTLFWTVDGLNGGSAFDDPRQLGYANPPEDTIVTWNSYFRDYTNGVPNNGSQDMVMFLAGDVARVSSREMSEQSWRYLRK